MMTYTNGNIDGQAHEAKLTAIEKLKQASLDNPDRKPYLGGWLQLPGANLGRIMAASKGLEVSILYYSSSLNTIYMPVYSGY